MGPALLYRLILPTLLGSAPISDTTTYADRATQELVARAVARHHMQDTTVHDYAAKIRYRVSFAFARRKWGNPLPQAVEEQDARVSWQLPNDLRIDMLGRRSKSALDGVDLASTFSHPWFVPRTLGDSVRFFGASQTPSRAAPHPFAAGADKYYHYAAGDSLVATIGGRRITVRAITVVPKSSHGAFVAGTIVVDVRSGEVVRFTFRFVGTELWSDPELPADSAGESRGSQFVSRILELNADLEYSLVDTAHWMPYHQVISGRVSLPFGIDFGVPFEARTTFTDYEVNSGRRIVFDAAFPRDTSSRGRNGGRIIAGNQRSAPATQPNDSTRRRTDSLRARYGRFRNRTGYLTGGGRFEIHRPPLDSMRTYQGWGDSLVLDDNSADRKRVQEALTDLGRLTDKLPRDMTGRQGVGFAWEKASDIFRYNRVEGTTLSYGEHLPLPLSFSDLYGTVRYGFGDERIMARAALVRDAPSGKLTISAARDLIDVDPFTNGLSFGNSLSAMFTGHDEGALLLAQGGELSYEAAINRSTEITWNVRAEQQRGVGNEGRAFFPRIVGDDGYFPEVTPVRNGFATGGGVRLDHVRPTWRWSLAADGLDVAGRAAGRVTGEVHLPRIVKGWVSLQLRGGAAVGVDSMPQLRLRAGGEHTVRGYDFGVAEGDALWSTQLDVAKPGKSPVRLVGFVDAGQAGTLSHFGDAPFLSGAGVGVSVLGGFIRADISHPISRSPGHGVRFDLIFGGPR